MSKNYQIAKCLSLAGILTAVAVPVHAKDLTFPSSTWSARDLEESSFLDVTSLQVTTVDGKALDLAKQSGWKVVYFWSAECPCVKACEEYTLAPLAKKYAGRISFYAVAANGYDLNKPVAELKTEAAAHKLPYPVVFDRSHATAKALHAEVTPEVFLIDPSNTVVYSGMPDDSKRYLKLTGKHGVTTTYLSRAIDEALVGLPVSQPHSELEGCIIAW